MNDIAEVSKISDASGHLTNYADGTNIFDSDSSYPDLLRSSRATFDCVHGWFLRMVLDTEKTKTILFRTKQQQIDTPSFISLSDSEIKGEYDYIRHTFLSNKILTNQTIQEFDHPENGESKQDMTSSVQHLEDNSHKDISINQFLHQGENFEKKNVSVNDVQ
ncbi:hypothetical protein WA026_008410 [Henosepilachna vigintioctopunctata]|uniref:Uncharacterized protein n=1 Tax=Henosepilachna vigintioctopunctata TaxID=420089 RepID=A0AAW1UGU4_9CUCU